MIVYGKQRKKYVLSQNPVSQDYDGAVYSVPEDPDILVKIYRPDYCTYETEKRVMDTANGKCSMLGEFPVDVVYTNGRFAGYIFKPSAPAVPSEPTPSPKPQPMMGEMAALLICLATGLALSALNYFIVFDKLRALFADVYCHWNFNGIPMIIGGWILMLVAYFQFRQKGMQAVIISIAAFLLGAIMVFGLISVLVWLLNAAFTLAKAILLAVLTILIVVWFFKSLFIKRRR